MKVSLLFHIATVETYVELVSYLPSSLSVCPVCYVPFVLLPQETQAFWPQSRQGGQRSVVNSVRVVVVVSLSLHHQQCDNFHKIQQENAKWTASRHFICGASLPFCLLVPFLKVCTTLL